MAQNLFQSTDIPLGARVEFFYQWFQWSKAFDQPIRTEPSSNENIQLIMLDNQEINAQQSLNASNPNQPEIDLCKILNSNTYGTSMLNSFKQAKAMNENLRKLLCESVLQYCIENKHDLTVNDSSKLAHQICKIFPGEEMVHFHVLSFFNSISIQISILFTEDELILIK